MPPSVALYGSSTTLQNPTATAASTALPPALSIASPASADAGRIAVTTPCAATTSSLPNRHSLRSVIAHLPRSLHQHGQRATGNAESARRLPSRCPLPAHG